MQKGGYHVPREGRCRREGYYYQGRDDAGGRDIIEGRDDAEGRAI